MGSNYRTARAGGPALVVSLIVLVLALTSCGGAAEPDPRPDSPGTQPDPSAAGILAESQAAGIRWTWPAAEIPGLEQRLVGKGPEGAVILYGAGRAPSTDIAVYLHSWEPDPPNVRAKQITALVRRGYTVVYPVYRDQDTASEDVLGNMLAGVEAAIHELAFEPGHLLVLGEAVGGSVAFDYAALAPSRGLPAPDLLVAIQPAGAPGGEPPSADHSAIDPETRILVAASTNQRGASGPASARGLLAGADRLPARQRSFFVADPDPDLGTGDAITAAYMQIYREVMRWLDRNER